MDSALANDPRRREILDRWSDFLRQNGQRMTAPREKILNAALALESPFTAEELLTASRAEDALISMPTIYRNLPLLVESGILRKAQILGDTQHYANDPAGAVDMKLVCRDTGDEIPLEDDCLRLRMLFVARQQGIHVEQISLRVEGHRRPS